MAAMAAKAANGSGVLNNSCTGKFFFLSVFMISAFHLSYVYYTTTKLHAAPVQVHVMNQTPVEFSRINHPQPSHAVGAAKTQQANNSSPSPDISQEAGRVHDDGISVENAIVGFQEQGQLASLSPNSDERPWKQNMIQMESADITASENNGVFHDRSLFLQDYKQMKQGLKIYTYPTSKDDPFANVFLPMAFGEPGGNYASESYFKKSLFQSHFLTDDPSKADLFYLPFSIAGLRGDRRIGVHGIQNFIRSYIVNISSRYPFWNRTGGADHFYVACHSVGRSAMEKAVEVKLNAIQVVCSSSYFLLGYIAHKDASIPQIWPRKGRASMRLPSQRKKLAFYAGAMNSRVRQFLIMTWQNDSDISVHRSRLKTPYSEALLDSRFCIHAKGFEVNTARIGDALYYGCVPVILADHYDLPYADILNWNSFSVVVATMDIPNLKKILQAIGYHKYLKLYRNVMEVQKHFLWHRQPLDYDAFHMVMYELWLRRSHVQISFDPLSY